ncbi:MAG TPA: hypothetical protein VLY20_09855 [Nitrospiria bacterium]|nr:hypothetical protein [Nitrospiria bacterium]
MKKLAAVFFILLFASTASAQVITNPSTNARMDGLGVQNWQVEDDFNIFINPAQIGNYKNNIYGELGTYGANTITVNNPNQSGINLGSQWGGMNMDVSYGTWGVYLGRPYSFNGPLNLMGAGSAPGNNRFDLFYGLHSSMPVGFYLSYADQSENTKSGGTTFKDQSQEFNLGAGGIFADGMLEGSLNITLPTSKCVDTTGGDVACGGATGNTFKSDAGPSFALLVRHHADMGNSKLLTTAQIQTIDASTKDSTSPTKIDDSTFGWRIDTALNSKPNPDTLVVAGIGLNGANRTIKLKGGGGKVTLDNLAIPVNVAVEHQTFKYVKTRIGLSKPLYNKANCKDTTGADTCSGSVLASAQKVDIVSDGAATVSAGIGWAVADNMTVDAVINQDVLFTGTYVVSGVPETLSSKISATYRFK